MARCRNFLAAGQGPPYTARRLRCTGSRCKSDAAPATVKLVRVFKATVINDGKAKTRGINACQLARRPARSLTASAVGALSEACLRLPGAGGLRAGISQFAVCGDAAARRCVHDESSTLCISTFGFIPISPSTFCQHVSIRRSCYYCQQKRTNCRHKYGFYRRHQ